VGNSVSSTFILLGYWRGRKIKMIKLRVLQSVVLAGLLFGGIASAGPTGLLGVQLVNPTINFVGNGPTDVTYDGVNYNIDSTALRVTFYDGGVAETVTSGDVILTAAINALGVLSSGTFSISGSVTDSVTNTLYSGVLLSGTINDYGMLNLGSTDLSDFILTATAGSLQMLFDTVGPTVGAVMALEASTFAGSFAQGWTAKLAKGDIGAIIALVEPGTILLMLLGLGILASIRLFYSYRSRNALLKPRETGFIK